MRRLRKLVARLEPKRGRSEWAGYREAAPYSDEDAERKEQLRPGGRLRAPRLGSRRERRALLARARRRVRASPWTATSASSASSTARCERRARRRSCRSWSTSPTPRRPAAGAALERRRLEERGRPDLVALPRARPPPGDRPQRPVRRARRLAARARRTARDRVRRPGRPDGLAPAGSEARRGARGLRAGGVRARRWARASRSSAASSSAPARARSTSPPRDRDAARGPAVVAGRPAPARALVVRGRRAALRPARQERRVLRRAAARLAGTRSCSRSCCCSCRRAVLLGLECAASRSLRWAVHAVFVAALVALFVLQAIRGSSAPGWLLVAVALVSGAAAAELYLRVPAARLVLTVLAPAPLLFLALFLLRLRRLAAVALDTGGTGGRRAAARAGGADRVRRAAAQLAARRARPHRPGPLPELRPRSPAARPGSSTRRRSARARRTRSRRS